MDTHLEPLNEAIVREREDAMRRMDARRRGPATTPDAPVSTRHRWIPSVELVVVTMFALLAAGFVSLVVTGLRV